MPRPVWVAVYDPGTEDAVVIAVTTDLGKLDTVVKAWKAKADISGEFLNPIEWADIVISQLDLIE